MHDPYARNKAYYRSDKGRASRRAYKFKTLYGITPEQFTELLQGQGNCCAICKTEAPPIRSYEDGRTEAG